MIASKPASLRALIFPGCRTGAEQEQKERAMNAPVETNEDLIYTVPDGIARMRFNRPQARNAFTFAMYEKMASLCESINADRSIKVLIMTGTGDKAFASGTDISQF